MKEKFDIDSLTRIIDKRIKEKSSLSYTYRLFRNPDLLRKKLFEETKELVNIKNKKQAIWEAADLLYFMLVFLAKRKVNIQDVERMLERRNKEKRLLNDKKLSLDIKRRLR